MTLDEKLAAVVPHERQVRFQQLDNAELIYDGSNISAVRNDNYDEFFIAEKGSTTAEITVKWDIPVSVGNIVLKENILCGQRVESFIAEAEQNGEYSEIYSGTVIGYKRIVPVKNIVTRSVKIKITDSRTEPTLAFLRIYKGE